MPTPEIINVVLVDDHRLFRKGMVELLNGFTGYRVAWEAENGKEFIRKLVPGDLPDVVLLDISMPVMDGYETARWLRQHFPGIKILVLSMSQDDESVLRMLQYGVDGFILKNADPSELHAALKALVKNGTYFDAGVNDALVRSFSRKKKPADALNELEIAFLKLICTDLPYKSFAPFLEVPPRTIESIRTRLFRKLQIRSRAGLVVYAIKQGIYRVE